MTLKGIRYASLYLWNKRSLLFREPHFPHQSPSPSPHFSDVINIFFHFSPILLSRPITTLFHSRFKTYLSQFFSAFDCFHARQHAIARICHANSVRPSVRPSVRHTLVQCESNPPPPPPRTCGNISKTAGNFSTKFYVPIMHSYLR